MSDQAMHAPGCRGAFGVECTCLAGAPPVPIGPDADRDARVAKRRAEDARKAAAALDALLGKRAASTADGVYPAGGLYHTGYRAGFADGYAASELQHNRHYGVAERIDIPGMDPFTLTRVDPDEA